MQAAHTLYARAKYHKHQTEGMRDAMRIYGAFLQSLKKKPRGTIASVTRKRNKV